MSHCALSNRLSEGRTRHYSIQHTQTTGPLGASLVRGNHQLLRVFQHRSSSALNWQTLRCRIHESDFRHRGSQLVERTLPIRLHPDFCLARMPVDCFDLSDIVVDGDAWVLTQPKQADSAVVRNEPLRHPTCPRDTRLILSSPQVEALHPSLKSRKEGHRLTESEARNWPGRSRRKVGKTVP